MATGRDFVSKKMEINRFCESRRESSHNKRSSTVIPAIYPSIVMSLSYHTQVVRMGSFDHEVAVW